MCANFKDPRSSDCKVTHKKHKKMAIFGLKIYLLVYNSKSTRRAKLNFGYNSGTYEWFMQKEFEGAWSCDQNVTRQKWAESGRFWSNISR